MPIRSTLKTLFVAGAASFLMAGFAFAAEEFTKGRGWTENYKFKNPTTEKLQEKAMSVERVGDSYVGVGIYK